MKKNELAYSSSSWACSEYIMDGSLIILVPDIYIILIDLCLVQMRRGAGLFIIESIQSRLSWGLENTVQ